MSTESKEMNAVKSGVILGIINIIITALIYVVDPSLFVAWWFGLLILVVNVVIVVVMGIKYRNGIGGYMSFGNAFMHGFITLVMAGLLGTLFNILLYTVIDPDLSTYIAEESMENTARMMENFGADDNEIDEVLNDMEESTAERFTITGLSIQFLWSILVAAVIALITGLIVRKNEPIEDI